MSFPPGVRFCDQDGTPLVGKSAAEAARAAAPPVALQQPEEPSWDSDWGDPEETGGKRTFLVVALVAAGLLLAGGGAYAYWAGLLDRWIGTKTDSELVSQANGPSRSSEGAAESKPAAPGLLGKYKAHLADQDITLVIDGEKAKPLVSSAGTVSYLNVVNGGACTALLVPVSGGGIGGDTGNAVSFRQTSVPGKPACPQDIPVKIDITGQPAGGDGVIRSISVEWHKGDSDKVLMAGTLEREVNQ